MEKKSRKSYLSYSSPVFEKVKSKGKAISLSELIQELQPLWSKEQIYADVRKVTQIGLLCFNSDMELELKESNTQ